MKKFVLPFVFMILTTASSFAQGIEATTVDGKKVKWSERWRTLSPEKGKLHELMFRNFREKYLRDHPEIKE